MELNGINVPDDTIAKLITYHRSLLTRLHEALTVHGKYSAEYVLALALTVGHIATVEVCYNFKSTHEANRFLASRQ